MNATAPPLKRLALAYAVYFGALGISAPYWNLYLDELGYSAKAIGTLSALVVTARIVASLGWSWLADHSARPLHVVRFASLLTALLFLGVFVSSELVIVGALMIAWSATQAACLPQLESMTFNHLETRRERYGLIRLWGSIGFMLTVVLLGVAIDRLGLSVMLVSLACCYGVLVAVFVALPAVSTRPSQSRQDVKLFAVVKSVWLLLLVCFLMQASHAPFYTFFSIHLSDLGYSANAIGGLWALGVLCEVAVFTFGARLARWAAPEKVLMLTFAAATVRWLIVAFAAHQPLLVMFSQCLHGLTFGAYHQAAISIIDRRFTGAMQHRGQALYASLTFGVGIALGSLFSGLIWERGGATAAFSAAAALALMATGLSFFGGLHRQQPSAITSPRQAAGTNSCSSGNA